MYLYDLVRLFPPNDKSVLRLIYKKEEVFCDRVDYLQFNESGMLHPLCNKSIAFWYVKHDPIDPNEAERTSDGKYIIVPNIMTVVITDSLAPEDKYELYRDIPDNEIELNKLILDAMWVDPPYVEFIGKDDDVETDIIRTNRVCHDMRMNKTPRIFDGEICLADDFYSRKIVGLDLSCLYINPEIFEPDVTGKYVEPIPRLTIILEGSIYHGNN